MPEPIIPTGAATVVAGAAVLPVLQAVPAVVPQIVILGISIGLRADLLVVGFAGSIVALTFFNAVPSTGDTLRHLVATTAWRMWWCLASSLTAGYLTPLVMLPAGAIGQHIPEQLLWSLTFLVGVAAQPVLGRLLRQRLGVDPPGASRTPGGAGVQQKGAPDA